MATQGSPPRTARFSVVVGRRQAVADVRKRGRACRVLAAGQGMGSPPGPRPGRPGPDTTDQHSAVSSGRGRRVRALRLGIAVPTERSGVTSAAGGDSGSARWAFDVTFLSRASHALM